MVSFPSRCAALAFLTAFVTLAAQILIHRMVSIKLVNNYAFLVISLTLLGFAHSGVILTPLLERFEQRFGDAISFCTSGFGVAMVLTSALFYRAGIDWLHPFSRTEFVASFWRFIPLALLYAVPFVFTGLILGALLSLPTLKAPRIYCYDLVGSALGALAALPLITQVGVETSVMLLCLFLLVGGLALVRPDSGAGWSALVCGLLLTGFALAKPNAIFAMNYAQGTILGRAQIPDNGFELEHLAWDPLARIEVTRVPVPEPKSFAYPAFIGGNEKFRQGFQRIITQNNTAFTFAYRYSGEPESLKGIEETIYAAAYVASDVAEPKVLVIGVGGGFDLLNALYFGAREVTGVEVNPATIKILKRDLRDYFRGWVEDPRVRLVLGEGRYFLTSTEERYDVLQLSGVDSASGTPAAAHVFSENFLYTEEAFDEHLSRLTDDGVLNMMRLEWSPPREMLRALATAVGALRRRGVKQPAQHIAIITTIEGNFTALLVKLKPFDEAAVERLREWTEANPYFSLSAVPGEKPDQSNAYRHFLSLGDPLLEKAFLASYPFDIRPVTDDRPFFFRFSYWWHLTSSNPLAASTIPVLELSVLLLLLTCLLAVALCVYLPLKLLSEPVAIPWRYTVYFGAIALGYLAAEIGFIQKFSLFLGHPYYALSVVLAGLLFFTGIGSLLSERWASTPAALLKVSLLLAVVLALLSLATSGWLTANLTLPFAARCLIVMMMLAPVGMLMGTFMPSGLELLKAEQPALAPWGWGINGIFSVLAPIVGIAIATTYGTTVLLLAAIPIYLLGAAALQGR